MSARFQALNDWLLDHFQAQSFSISPIPGDASFRRYFRVQTDNKTFIAMDAPPELEDIHPFISITHLFSENKICVPVIFAENLDHGFLLLSDFGDHLFSKILQPNNATHLYESAFSTLLRIQHCQATLPNFDAAFMQRELSFFQEWFLEKHLGIEIPASILNTTFEFLITSAEQQPQVCVHRDYHSRNLMWLENEEVGVLDFQDAVWGPVTYDLVSLIRDCYIDWPTHQVIAWADSFRQQSTHLKTVSSEQFLRWFDLMGIQRHLKALFIFARKYLRDGTPNYLADIPRTLNYVLTVSENYPELKEFRERLK